MANTLVQFRVDETERSLAIQILKKAQVLIDLARQQCLLAKAA